MGSVAFRKVRLGYSLTVGVGETQLCKKTVASAERLGWNDDKRYLGRSRGEYVDEIWIAVATTREPIWNQERLGDK